MSEGTPHVRIEETGKVLTLTLDRPEKKNALTQAMYRTLAAELRRADGSPEIAAVIVAGAPGAFTAGNDLADFMGGPSAGAAAAMDLLHAVCAMETPLIAAVDGLAIGIGTTLLLHCDFAYATPDAHFRTPFVDLGLCAEGASSLLLSERVGWTAARRLLMLGEALSGEEAAALGLVSATAADPLAAAQATAQTLAAKPTAALRATKRLLRDAREDAVRRAIDREAGVFAERLASPEAAAAMAAFFQRG